ncbi:MAG: M28 family peptidase [Acidobacteriota bacterium]|nr:M28 family peptidase [Acidobacteriota bacterium]
MKHKPVKYYYQRAGLLLFIFLWLAPASSRLLAQNRAGLDQTKWLKVLHEIASQPLYDLVSEFSSEKYHGRLSGTDGYNQAVARVASLLETWGLEPTGDNGSYLQAFPDPYTLVLERGEVSLHLPVTAPGSKKPGEIKKFYRYEDEYFPGGTSASGEITAEVVYAGFGITAPELGYDDYKGIDVRGKIVLIENEVPISPDKDPETFKKWRQYSFHQYKLQNAAAHGAKGLLYYYGPIVNPNSDYIDSFIYSYVGQSVVDDIFAGSGKTYQETVAAIKKNLKPQSFKTGKVFTIKNKTEHHPEGQSYNLLARVKGVDPVLKEEVIIISGHLDHVGSCPDLMPGANDNASSVAVMLGVAQALMKGEIEAKRTILFAFFGAEEQGVKGSEFYLEHPVYPLEKTIGLINLDGVGSGDKILVLAGKNFPWLYQPFEKANNNYIHRSLDTNYWPNLTRPRLDAARFMEKNIPALSFSVSGLELPYPAYHNTRDNLAVINPEILEDVARLLFLGVLELAMASPEKLKPQAALVK